MQGRLFKLVLITLVCVLGWTPNTITKPLPNALDSQCTMNSEADSELDVSHVELVYDIYPTGGYVCHFTLESLGNNYTAIGIAHCAFNISEPVIEDFELTVSEKLVTIRKIPGKNWTIISFSIQDQTIPIGYPFTIQGSYYGSYEATQANIYNYTFGIDWGTIVGSQHTVIKFGTSFTSLSISPTPHLINPPQAGQLGVEEFHWNEILQQTFQAKLRLHLRQTQNTYLNLDLTFWNASIGETKHLCLQNNGSFTTTGYLVTPVWIDSNVTSFQIRSEEIIIISLIVNSQASVGMNGTIDIIVIELHDVISIPVFIISASSQSEMSVLIIISSLLVGIFAISVGIYQREWIMKTLDTYAKRNETSIKKSELSGSVPIPENTTEEIPAWDVVKTRWEPVLPQQELQVIEILLHQGMLNQKAIADQMQISEMTMSRIISRLESKRLLVREPLGMSNMIRLNKKVL